MIIKKRASFSSERVPALLSSTPDDAVDAMGVDVGSRRGGSTNPLLYPYYASLRQARELRIVRESPGKLADANAELETESCLPEVTCFPIHDLEGELVADHT